MKLEQTPNDKHAPRVLLDNSVWSRSSLAQGELIDLPGITNKLFTLRAKPEPDTDWVREQIECLPTIGRLTREDRITIHVSAELIFESWKGHRKDRFSNVFGNVKFGQIPSAVSRDGFSQLPFDRHISKEELIKFCKHLIEFDESKLPQCGQWFLSKLTEAQLENLKNVERFRNICRYLPEKMYDDAYHMWTGECAGMNYFLTMDTKFRKCLHNAKGLALPCAPIYPSDFLTVLGIKDREPMPYEYDKRHMLNGRPYD